MKFDVDEVFEAIKKGPVKYDEEMHCKLLLKVMLSSSQGTMSAFCVEAHIGDTTFYQWIEENELFANVYAICKMYSREAWEDEGRDLKNYVAPIGTISYAFEYWKLIGWSRFGISKNSRIRLKLKASDNPNQHYAQLLKQASDGDFTAGELKQLMEAVNVGLNTHQAFKLQAEIDELKSDLATMQANTNVHNTITNQGIAQKD